MEQLQIFCFYDDYDKIYFKFIGNILIFSGKKIREKSMMLKSDSVGNYLPCLSTL